MVAHARLTELAGGRAGLRKALGAASISRPAASAAHSRRAIPLPHSKLSFACPPLDIKFEKCGRNPEFDHAHASALLAALVPHSNRWKRVSLSFGLGGRGVFGAFSGIRGNFAQLHRLEITDPHVAAQRWPSGTRDVLDDAPQLRAAQLMNGDPDLDSPLISVPWHQLTELRARCEVEHFFANMRKTHHVVDCAVDISEGEIFVYLRWPQTATRVIEPPNLRDLFVGEERPLRFLEAPKLRSLHMKSMFDGEVVPAFLRRSQCRLQTLKINECLFARLREVPTLAHMSHGLDRAAQGIYGNVEGDGTKAAALIKFNCQSTAAAETADVGLVRIPSCCSAQQLSGAQQLGRVAFFRVIQSMNFSHNKRSATRQSFDQNLHDRLAYCVLYGLKFSPCLHGLRALMAQPVVSPRRANTPAETCDEARFTRVRARPSRPQRVVLFHVVERALEAEYSSRLGVARSTARVRSVRPWSSRSGYQGYTLRRTPSSVATAPRCEICRESTMPDTSVASKDTGEGKSGVRAAVARALLWLLVSPLDLAPAAPRPDAPSSRKEMQRAASTDTHQIVAAPEVRSGERYRLRAPPRTSSDECGGVGPGARYVSFLFLSIPRPAVVLARTWSNGIRTDGCLDTAFAKSSAYAPAYVRATGEASVVEEERVLLDAREVNVDLRVRVTLPPAAWWIGTSSAGTADADAIPARLSLSEMKGRHGCSLLLCRSALGFEFGESTRLSAQRLSLELRTSRRRPEPRSYFTLAPHGGYAPLDSRHSRYLSARRSR
ncbi:hypothetical protein C8R45DRAFT_940068 [Mycena sanguinolenta]|nr:hypothetical protein C8R45DRAFT_940068 [Mycena sanguinolenta]